jgi:hydroxymethylpyrimidine pyrophosphatase-like HAD family hydrolase
MTYKHGSGILPTSMHLDVDGVLGKQGSYECSACVPYVLGGLKKKGRYSISSGRWLGYLEDYCSRNGLDPDAIVAENGGVISIGGKEYVFKNGNSIQHLTERVAEKMKGDSIQYKGVTIPCRIEPKKTILTLSCSPGYLGITGQDEATTAMYASLLGDFLRSEISASNGHKFHLYIHPDAAEVVPDGLSKEYGIIMLGELLNLDAHRALFVGDGENDVPAFMSVGFPATVGNASQKVKRIVRERNGYVAEAEHGDGVREICQEMFEFDI